MYRILCLKLLLLRYCEFCFTILRRTKRKILYSPGHLPVCCVYTMLLRCTQSVYATLTRENAIKYDRGALYTAFPTLNVTCNSIEYTTIVREIYTKYTCIVTKTIFLHFSFSYLIRRFVCCASKKRGTNYYTHELKSSSHALCKFKQRYRK